MKVVLYPILMSVALGACSFTGYGGTSQFRCSHQHGISNDPLCASISSNYDASVAGTLGQAPTEAMNAAAVQTLMRTSALSSGTPIRSPAEIARIWIAPYLDTDGDLIDQSFTYVTINTGQWLIAHNQQAIVDEYRPIRLLGTNTNLQPTDNNQPTQPPADGVPDIGVNFEHLNQNNFNKPSGAGDK